MCSCNKEFTPEDLLLYKPFMFLGQNLHQTENSDLYCNSKHVTVKPRFNKRQCNEVLGITSDILQPGEFKSQ